VSAGHVNSFAKRTRHDAVRRTPTSGGSDYTQRSAEELGIAECFTAFLPKPQLLIDDVSIHDWEMTELHPNECRSMTVPELLDRLAGLSRIGPSASDLHSCSPHFTPRSGSAIVRHATPARLRLGLSRQGAISRPASS
jgi:hypothetical protein